MREAGVLRSTLIACVVMAAAGCSGEAVRAKPAAEKSTSDSVTLAQKPGTVYAAFQYVNEIAGTELELRLCDGDTAVAQSVGAQLGGLGKPVRVEASTCKTPSRSSANRFDVKSVRCTVIECHVMGHLTRLPSTWKVELHVRPSTSLQAPSVQSALYTLHETYD